METETVAATNHNQVLESTPELAPDSTFSGENNTITRIDRKLYEAAVEGNFQPFIDVQNMKSLLTPTKNSILHLHLTSSTPKKVSPTSCVGHFLPKCRDLIYQTVPENVVSQQFVEQILDKCGDLILLSNSKKETPLHIAARHGHSEIAVLLIERAKALPPQPHQDIENGSISIGAEKELIRATNSEGDTALHEAVRYHHFQVVKILLEMDPDYSYYANNANETPLFLASERKYIHMVRQILEKVKSPAYDGPNNRTALHAAVINRDIAMTNELIIANVHVRGAVKHADKKGWVPLHYAVKMGDHHLTKLLLKQDENTAYMQDNEGRTALHVAAYCGHRLIVEMIIRYYPDCAEIVDKKGWNALHYAVNGNRPLTVNRIVCNLALSNLYNEKDVNGNTPLHHLANSRIFAYKYVFHHRVDKLAVNNKDQTPLDVAYSNLEDSILQMRKRGMIRQLEQAGATRSQRNLEKKDGQENNYLGFTKEAKESHLLVATLIATVTFAAGITLPGGTIQDGDGKGTPVLGQRTSFKAFMISNTISLVLAASAAFMHLFSPLKKAKWKDGYLSQVAFSFTLVAIATMTVAFVTATYAVLGSSSTGIAATTIGLAFFLVFKQVLDINFGASFLSSLIENVFNIIIFPFIRFTPRAFGFFCHPFQRHVDEQTVVF